MSTGIHGHIASFRFMITLVWDRTLSMNGLKSFGCSLAVLFLPSLCFCAEANAPVNEASLYSKALLASVAEMEKSWDT